MREHGGPARLHVGAMRLQVDELRHLDTFEGAFLAQDIEENCLIGQCFRVAEQIDHVVEVARPGAFRQRPEFLGKGLDIVIGQHLDTFLGSITVRVKYRHPHRVQNDTLGRHEIELDARPSAGSRRDRPGIAQLALARAIAARIGEDIEILLVGRHLDAGLLLDPSANLAEGLPQKLGVKMRLVAQGEVEVFGKAIRLEKAFLETGATFEYPRLGDCIVCVDARKDPAKNVILLDYVGA
jgi:hypothetical protein